MSYLKHVSAIFPSFSISFYLSVYHALLLIIYFYAQDVSYFSLKFYVHISSARPGKRMRRISFYMVFTPSAVARRPPFLVVSLINPEWLAWKPLVFVLERARTVNFVGSGLLRNMADLGTRVVLRSSCLSFRSFAFRFFPCSPSPTANACVAIRLALRLAFLWQRFFISDPVFFIPAVRLKCKLFLYTAGTPQSVNVTLLNSFATYNYHTRWHTISLSAKFIVRRQHTYCTNGKIRSVRF